MAIIWNPTKETISTRMQGAWFTFKPDVKKTMDDAKCRFIESERKDTGLVVLPDQFDPQSEAYVEHYDKTPEGTATLEQKREEGIRNLLDYHREIIRNNQVSLRRDLAHKYPDGDSKRLTALEMSKGEIESLQLIAKYQKSKMDGNEAKINEISKLLDLVGPIGE